MIRFCLEAKRVFLCGIFSLTSKYERVQVGFVFVCLCIVAGTMTTKKQSNFEKLCPADQDIVRQIVQIMDRFSISIDAYHKLSQVDASLPRTYLIEGCMHHHDKKIAAKMMRTPGEAPGCVLPLKPLLIAEIRRHVSAK